MARGRQSGPGNGYCRTRTAAVGLRPGPLTSRAASVLDQTHTFGAAVRDRDGRLFGGINLYHFTGGPCAELVALGHARASGASELSTIVAMRDQRRGAVGPCGRDRQVLFDYHPQIRVILPTPEGVRNVRIADLMPLASVWTPGEGTQDFDPTIWDA